MKWVAKKVEELKSDNLFNEIKEISSPIEGRIKIGKKEYINFSSNNYLGLANDRRIKTAAIKAIEKYGIGPGAVRTIAGTTKLHAALEKKLAKFKKCEAVITTQSGFTANLAVVPAITGEDDVIFSDELNHASIIDACKLSKATVVRFAHSDMKDLENVIKKTEIKGRGIIITDGVFSMDGDIAKLPEIVKLAKKYKLMTMVDDAHGEGVLGSHGRGIVDHFDLHGKVDIEVGTMSKAFGSIGGLIAGSSELIEWLSQRARPFLFSSAMTIPDVASCIKAVEILEKDDKEVKKLWKNAAYMKDQFSVLGFDTGKSETPIIPVMLGEAELAHDFAKKLYAHGVFAKSIVYPTVPMGKARIRLMNTASHTKHDLDEAIKAFSHVGKDLGVI